MGKINFADISLLGLPPPYGHESCLGNTGIYAGEPQDYPGNTCIHGGEYKNISTCQCEITPHVNMSLARAILTSIVVKLSIPRAILTTAEWIKKQINMLVRDLLACAHESCQGNAKI